MALLRIFMVLGLLAAAALATTWSPNLRVRFEFTAAGIGTYAFIEVPKSTSAADEAGWVEVERPAGPLGLSALRLRCPPQDYALCVLLDDTGYIAGLQIAIDEDNFSGAIFDWKTQGFTRWTTSVAGVPKNFWAAQQYYISETTTWSPNLRVRFEFTAAGIGTYAFIEVPKSTSAADEAGWVEVERPAGPLGLSALRLRCPPQDYALCVLLDDTGYIAGLQIAIDEDNFSGAIFDWKTQGFTRWTTSVAGVPKNFWAAQQYYISESTLATAPEARIAARDDSTILQDGAVWVTGFHGELNAISTNTSVITAEDSIYKEQACIPWMGEHYYYGMTKETKCEVETLFPWFPLIDAEQLVGVGFIAYGQINIAEGNTDWFEGPDEDAVRMIIPNGPECLYELVRDVGLVTLHTYFIDTPFQLNCA